MTLCGTDPSFAMNTPVNDAPTLTPIKKGLSFEPQREDIRVFLNGVLKPENELKRDELEGPIGSRRDREYRFYEAYQSKDQKLLWIKGNGGLQRYLGYCYLQKALDFYKEDRLCVAPTKFVHESQGDEISVNILYSKRADMYFITRMTFPPIHNT